MSFIEIAKKRYSCRKYQDKKVEKEKLDIILEAGHVAPTAANYQPQRLLVIEEKEGMEKLSKSANTFGAPLVIVVCSDKETAWVRPFDQMITTDIDASIVTDHMMLAAADLGLDSVWICYFNPETLREDFQIPEQYVPVNILAIGYGDRIAKSPNRHSDQRLPLNQTVFYEEFK